MLSENVEGVKRILEILKPRILSQELPGWSCGCGALKGAAATAVEIRPAGDQYPGQEVMWYLWTVKMEPKPGEQDGPWSCGISEFVPRDELKSLFKRHFPSA